MYSLNLIHWPEGDITAYIVDSPDMGHPAFELLRDAKRAAKDIWKRNVREGDYFIGIRNEDRGDEVGNNIGWVEFYPKTTYKPTHIM